MLRSLSLHLALAAALTVSLSAQVSQHESLTQWTHLGSSPSWTDDVPDASAEFAVVDQLNSTSQLEYSGTSMILDPGTYVASCRVKKTQSAVGVADIDLDVTAGTTLASSRLLASAQTVDAWVRIPYVTFTLLTQTTVAVRLHNMDAKVTKQNYRFDSLVIGRIEIGDTAYYQSMTTWPHVSGSNPVNYVAEAANNDSAGGIGVQLNWVDKLEFTPLKVSLPPGTYTAHVRFMKTATQLQKAVPLGLEVSINGVKTKATLSGALQPSGQLVHTPPLTFTVKANDVLEFRFGQLAGGSRVYDYFFDSLIVRPGVFNYYGTPCPVPGGVVSLDGGSAWMGRQFHAIAKNAPYGGIFNMGFLKQNIDLSPFGVTGCYLLASIDASVSMMFAGGGSSVVQFPVPVNPTILGVTFYAQAIAIVPGLNVFGIVTSNAAEVRVVQ